MKAGNVTAHDVTERSMTERDMTGRNPQNGIVLTPEQQRSRRNRNIAIGVAVGFFVVLFYAVTIVKLGPGVLSRPL